MQFLAYSDFNPRSPHGERLPREICEPVPVPISIHAPRTGSDGGVPERHRAPLNFNPRSPHGERPQEYAASVTETEISIHAPRTGSDTSTPSSARSKSNFNPRSPHGERLYARAARHGKAAISIHAPRTGSDMAKRGESRGRHAFQSTLPARGATALFQYYQRYLFQFQSTLPARGATIRNVCIIICRRYFNPRSPHGERHVLATYWETLKDFNPRSPHGERPNDFVTFLCVYDISIHAPRTGSDPQARRRGRHDTISIHAPRTGSDPTPGISDAAKGHFNPRSPHGERPACTLTTENCNVFQSTLPARGATQQKRLI